MAEGLGRGLHDGQQPFAVVPDGSRLFAEFGPQVAGDQGQTPGVPVIEVRQELLAPFHVAAEPVAGEPSFGGEIARGGDPPLGGAEREGRQPVTVEGPGRGRGGEAKILQPQADAAVRAIEDPVAAWCPQRTRQMGQQPRGVGERLPSPVVPVVLVLAGLPARAPARLVAEDLEDDRPAVVGEPPDPGGRRGDGLLEDLLAGQEAQIGGAGGGGGHGLDLVDVGSVAHRRDARCSPTDVGSAVAVHH